MMNKCATRLEVVIYINSDEYQVAMSKGKTYNVLEAGFVLVEVLGVGF
jgi:hypothetical protein